MQSRTTASEMTLNPGDRLDGDRYEIEKTLGWGRTTITYLALDRNSGQRVAIKTLSDSAKVRSDAAEIRRDFYNELSKLSKLDHPHVVKVDQLFEADNSHCLVMERIAGDNLKTLCPLPFKEAMVYIRQIGAALDHMHSKKIFHRDVRPANILVRAGKQEAVLINFGSALSFSDQLSATAKESHKDGCAAPETYTSQGEFGSYTDIYSLGATLYTMLEGIAPPQALHRQINGVVIPYSGKCDPKIVDLINKAMKLKPTDRPQSVEEWLHEFPQESKEPSIFNFKKLNWSNAIAMTAAVGAVLAGIGAMKVWFPSEPTPSPTPTVSPAQSPPTLAK